VRPLMGIFAAFVEWPVTGFNNVRKKQSQNGRKAIMLLFQALTRLSKTLIWLDSTKISSLQNASVANRHVCQK
jgi:hypothetical protein